MRLVPTAGMGEPISHWLRGKHEQGLKHLYTFRSPFDMRLFVCTPIVLKKPSVGHEGRNEDQEAVESSFWNKSGWNRVVMG